MPSSLPTVFMHNLTATTDPGPTNDGSAGQNYSAGSYWFNTATNRVWFCVSAAINAAVWGELTANGAGLINRQISATGVQPGGTAADNVLAVYSLPANSFDVAGRAFEITACGTYGATANSKTVKLILNPSTAVVGSTVGSGGTTICSTGTVTTNGGGWSLRATFTKYGVAGSNTQLGLNLSNQQGSTTPVIIAPAAITAVESGAILIAVTGNAATAASDILFNYLEIYGKN